MAHTEVLEEEEVGREGEKEEEEDGEEDVWTIWNFSSISPPPVDTDVRKRKNLGDKYGIFLHFFSPPPKNPPQFHIPLWNMQSGKDERQKVENQTTRSNSAEPT